jgi:hypothetical protein
MAIIDARQLRSLTLSESKGDKQTIQRSATEEFLIIADAKDPPFGDILASQASFANLGNNRLPQVDDEITLSGGITLVVSGRELSHYKDNERAVVMKVRYDGKPEGPGLPEPQGIEPTTWQRITIQTQGVTKPALGWSDLDDVPAFSNAGQLPARNSAGDPVDGLEEESALVRLTYTNTQVLSPRFDQLLRYTNTCNNGEFLGGPEYSVRMTGWTGEYDQKNNVWTISIEFLYKPDLWELQYFDAGFNEVVGGDRKAILDKAGNPVGQPVPLDGNGGQLTIGSDPLVRYLYPYQKVNMAQIFSDCGI